MQVCTLLQTGNHASTPPLSFLQAGCPSCRPTNSIKALKAKPCAVPQKWVKRVVRQNVGQLSLFWKNILPFSHVELCGYNNTPNVGTVIFFWRNLGQFPHLPKNRGTRWRIQSRDIKITPYLQLFEKYEPSIRWFWELRANKKRNRRYRGKT